MPLYEYKCQGCGEVFEIIQKFSDEPLKVHEKCGGAVERLISRSALHFKGSGFYVNDYAKSNGGTKKDSSDSASTKDSAAKSSETKSDTKSETKSETKSADSSSSSSSSSTSSTPSSKSE